MYTYGGVEDEKTVDSLQKWFEENDKLPSKIGKSPVIVTNGKTN